MDSPNDDCDSVVHHETASIADLERYLYEDSQRSSSEDLQPPLPNLQKTVPEILNSMDKENMLHLSFPVKPDSTSKESFNLSSVATENLTVEASTDILKRYKKQNIQLRHELQYLTKESKSIHKMYEQKCDELKQSLRENEKLNEIVKCVMGEVIGEEREFEDSSEAIKFISGKFDVIKKTVVGTQRALMKQKEIIKSLKKENERAKKENFANLELVLKMNHMKFDRSFDKGREQERKVSHKKANSLFVMNLDLGKEFDDSNELFHSRILEM